MAYIEREKLIEFLRNTRLHLPKESKDFFTRDEMLLNFEQYVNLIEPAADVVEARHGKWIIKNDEKDWRDKDYYRLVIKCSICGKSHFLGTTKYRNEYDEEKLKELGNVGDYSYCGKCGAKMDGKDGE